MDSTAALVVGLLDVVGVDLVKNWSKACAFARGKTEQRLYDLLVPLSHHRADLDRIAIAVGLAARRSSKPADGTSLEEMAKALAEFQLLEDIEQQLSVVPQSHTTDQQPARSLLAGASGIHPRWLAKNRPPRDYDLAEKDQSFRERKRRAVKQLVALMPQVETEVLAVAAKRAVSGATAEKSRTATRVRRPAKPDAVRKPRAKQPGKRDIELVTLLLQDREAGWIGGIRHKGIGELEEMLGATRGALRPERIRSFLQLREHYLNHPDADAKVPASILQQMSDGAKKCVHEYDDDAWKATS